MWEGAWHRLPTSAGGPQEAPRLHERDRHRRGSLWDKSGSPSWVPGSWLTLVGLAVLGTASCGLEELVALRRSECSRD